jgi:hypothetical protein
MSGGSSPSGSAGGSIAGGLKNGIYPQFADGSTPTPTAASPTSTASAPPTPVARSSSRIQLEDYFEKLEWVDMNDVIHNVTEFGDDGVNKAISEYNETMRKALKQLGRLATRLGYIKGE